MGNKHETNDDHCEECIHHWLIDQKNCGVCRKCGEIRQFPRAWSALSIQAGWRSRASKVQNTVPGTNP